MNREELERMSEAIADRFREVIQEKEIDLILAENVWCVAANPAVAPALEIVRQEFGIPAVAHNHDFYWERREGFSLTCAGAVELADKHDWFLDPAIQMIQDPEPGANTMINRTPLLVNLVNSWSLRPEAHTNIKNLFLASDYVRTFTDLATMEGANEAARRAVNSLLDRDGSDAHLCKIWNLHEPDILAPLRWWDKRRFAKGLPYTPALPSMGHFLGWIRHTFGKFIGHH